MQRVCIVLVISTWNSRSRNCLLIRRKFACSNPSLSQTKQRTNFLAHFLDRTHVCSKEHTCFFINTCVFLFVNSLLYRGLLLPQISEVCFLCRWMAGGVQHWGPAAAARARNIGVHLNYTSWLYNIVIHNNIAKLHILFKNCNTLQYWLIIPYLTANFTPIYHGSS